MSRCSTSSTLHPLTVQEWVRRAELHRAVQVPGTSPALWAWLSMLHSLRSGESLPGLGHGGAPGTWEDLWSTTASVPRSCPWSVMRPPRGWSYRSYMAQAGASLICP
jgi:hypothetical protein